MEKLLNIYELAEILGFSPRIIYDWIYVGFVPHYKFPKGVRSKLSEINKWISKKRKSRI